MFMTKIKSVLMAAMIVGLALGAISVGIAEAGQQNEKGKDKTLVVAAILESVDAKKAVLTAALGENETAAAERLLSLVTSGREPAPGEIDRVFKFVYAFNKPTKLVDVPVRSEAQITRSRGERLLCNSPPTALWGWQSSAFTLLWATAARLGNDIIGVEEEEATLRGGRGDLMRGPPGDAAVPATMSLVLPFAS